MRKRVNEAQIRRFERIAWPNFPVLLRTARYLTRDEHEAEDLVQDTMIKAMRAIDRFQDGTDAKAWLLTIQRRIFIDKVRAGKRSRHDISLDSIPGLEIADSADREAGQFDEHWDEPEQLMERFADHEVIAALHTLPVEIRWTLLLVDVEQLDQAQASEILDVPVGTVKSRAHRGRRMLRDRLFEFARERRWVQTKEEESP